MSDLIIAVAPVPGEKQKEKFPGELNTADEVIRSWNEGASLAHLHVRDSHFLQSVDTHWFENDLSVIRKSSDIIIEGSTGGAPEHTLKDRCVSFGIQGVEMGTLNLGSINMYDGVYSNCESDIYYYARNLKENNIVPSLICFDLSHFYMKDRLEADGLIRPNPAYTYFLCMNTPNTLPYSKANLDLFIERIPKGSNWFLTLYHALGVDSFRYALECGGHVRVGYEDGPFLSNGDRSGSNARLVAEVAAYAKAIGRTIASPARAREMMGIPQLTR